jgi:hypothetical protein
MPLRQSKIRYPEPSAASSEGRPARSSRDGMPMEAFNFRCSTGMAREVVRAMKKEGGLRQVLGRLLRKDGYRIPEWDTLPSPRHRDL